MDFLKQIHIECNGLGQPRSSKETAHFGKVSEFSWVSHTSHHVLNMPPKGVHSLHTLVKFHEERMACQVCGPNNAVPKVTSSWSRETKDVNFMRARQRNLLATSTLGFAKHFKD